jgi:hypothetical protein
MASDHADLNHSNSYHNNGITLILEGVSGLGYRKCSIAAKTAAGMLWKFLEVLPEGTAAMRS